MSDEIAPEAVKEGLRRLLAAVDADEVTEVYDQVEALLNRISSTQHPDLAWRLTEAKTALWHARMAADEAAGRVDA